MRKENGISLMKFLVLIVIIFIIVIIAVYSMKNAYEKSNANKYIAEMQLIQEKVNFIRNEYKLWDKYNPNEAGNFNSFLIGLGFVNANSPNNVYMEEFKNIINELNVKVLKNWDSSTDSILTNYFYFSPEELEELLGIKNKNLHVIINFYSGNVISKNGIKENNQIIHRQYDSELGDDLIITSIYNSIVTPTIEIIENKGLTQKIKLSLKNDNTHIYKAYYYKDAIENKKLCNTLKNYYYIENENAIYFTIDVSGKYTFIVEDSNFVQYPKIELEVQLCNPPILLENMMGIYWDEHGIEKQITSEYDANWYNYSKQNLYMANAKTEDGNYWVWLPRYLYKETTEGIDIQFVNGTSKIPTNNTILTGYKVQETFSGNNELEGIWVAKYQTNIEEEKINIKPGKTLNFIETRVAINIYEKYLDKSLRNYINIMTENDRKAILDYSKFMNIEILNNLIHYAGGSPDENGFKKNIQYSSTNNESGIYDLFTSENEITKDSKLNEEGRFRGIIKIQK